MLLYQNNFLRQILFFNHSRQNKYVTCIWQPFHNKYLNTDFSQFFFWFVFNTVFTLNVFLPFLFGVFLCFIYIVVICFVTNNRNILLKSVISYLYFIFYNCLFLKCVWVLCRCYYSCLLSTVHFIPLITALLQIELILHKQVCNYRLL